MFPNQEYLGVTPPATPHFFYEGAEKIQRSGVPLANNALKIDKLQKRFQRRNPASYFCRLTCALGAKFKPCTYSKENYTRKGGIISTHTKKEQKANFADGDSISEFLVRTR